ncbi:MAG TPA: efflux RND transporter periplasmic adaptor subunit [Vicinamibacterales bacterium]|jgi:multidrug efflux system membrane fusion protein|nr:efflux RND transporter periplasmic adaptor subunit [Vicinamibacterales bacterium]
MRTLSTLSGFALLAALTAACSGEAVQQTPGAGTGRGGGQNPPIPVTIASVEQKAVPLDVQAIGTVIAASTVAVHAQITGELTSVNFKEGDEVQQGQVLFTLDKRPLEAALLQAEANLQRDIALTQNAQAQSVRYDDLLKRGIATHEQVDQFKSTAASLDATVMADRAAVDSAKVQLEYATISAPITGRTGLLQVHRGNLVRAGDTIPIVTLNRIQPVYVTFAIPESMLPQFKHYMAAGSVRVEAKAPNEDGRPSVGQIDFIDNAVDATTGTIKIKGTFANEDRRLWPGLFVNVTVTLTTDPNATVVPTAAVQSGQQGTYVYVVKSDQTVELRPVTVARTRGDRSIVGSGLRAGETIVTDGHLRLIPGSRVSVKTDTQKAAS